MLRHSLGTAEHVRLSVLSTRMLNGTYRLVVDFSNAMLAHVLVLGHLEVPKWVSDLAASVRGADLYVLQGQQQGNVQSFGTLWVGPIWLCCSPVLVMTC